MASRLFLSLASVAVLTVYLVLLRNPKRRRIVLQRLHITCRPRALSRASSPPSDFPSAKSLAPATSPTYTDVLPPSCNRKGSVNTSTARFIPLGKPWSTPRGDELTPTGFPVTEARRLVGSMPDYASLSGIPAPQPVWDGWTIEKSRARPYRPLRWGYHQTMSLMKLDPSYWLELESTYVRRLRQRCELFDRFGGQVLQCLSGAEVGCHELMEMVIMFLCQRYPAWFVIENRGEGQVLKNEILGTETRIDVEGEEALKVLLENIPEDFALMQRNPEDGLYYFRGGVICSAMGWSLGTKIGKKLADVHAPVPDFKEKMQFSMDRYFAKMPTDSAVQRGSWGLEKGEALFAGPGTEFGQALEHERSLQDPTLKPEDVTFRVDWQTLRRLPVTGFIVFNFKALFTPLPDFRTEPYIPKLLQKVLMEGKESIMQYKGTWAVEHVVLPELERWAQEQEDEGLVERDWEVGTLGESPWFPGWTGRWRERNGVSGAGTESEGWGRER